MWCRDLWKNVAHVAKMMEHRRCTRCVRRTHLMHHLMHATCSPNTSHAPPGARDVFAKHISCRFAFQVFAHLVTLASRYSASPGAMAMTMQSSVSSVLSFLGTVHSLTPDVFEAAQAAQSSHLMAILRSSPIDHADASAAMGVLSATPLFTDPQKSALMHAITVVMSGVSSATVGGGGQQRHRALHHYLPESLWAVVLSHSILRIRFSS